MRLYRVTKSNPPTEEDMMSYWDLGRRPDRPEDDPKYEGDKAAYEEVSTFATAEQAAAKARARNLGDFIAELEVPDETPMSAKGSHRGLIGTTPTQLLGMVQNVRGVDEV
jgi:hypothetical protein